MYTQRAKSNSGIILYPGSLLKIVKRLFFYAKNIIRITSEVIKHDTTSKMGFNELIRLFLFDSGEGGWGGVAGGELKFGIGLAGDKVPCSSQE